MIGKHVIVRANGAGVFFGVLKEKTGDEATLTDVRKLHYWDGAGAVEEISQIGTRKPENCRFTVTVEEICIQNVLQTIPCTEKAIEVIKGVAEWRA